MTYAYKETAENDPIKKEEVLNPILKKMGATSWNDAATCILVYMFLLTMLFSILVVTVTFVGSFFSGIKV